MADNYVDLHYNSDAETMTEQEGIELHGRDGIFCTSPIYTDIPLLTKSQSVAEAINELFQEGTGAAYNGSLRAVIDNETSEITIVVGETPEDSDEEQYTDYSYSYTAIDRSEEIKTESTVDGETTTTVETFEQRIITELYNAAGKLIMRTDYDSDTGEIKGFYDANDVPIYIEEWR